MTLYVVGQFRLHLPVGDVWDLQGVFSDRDKAVAACRNETYFLFPVELDAEAPDEPVVPPGLEYPLTPTEGTSTGPDPEVKAGG